MNIISESALSDNSISFIKGGGQENQSSYKEIFVRAKCALLNLQNKGVKPGDEIVFQLDNNESFIIIFWACLLGKFIPIPLARGNQSDHKFKVFNVWKELKNPYLVSDFDYLGKLDQFSENGEFSGSFKSMKSRFNWDEDLLKGTSEGVVETVSHDDIAYIQYSSGSTGTPKGVILSHGNLVANIKDIAHRSKMTSSDRILSWMPLTHDMGLICFHLSGMLLGCSQFIMDTAVFIRRPILWLLKASEHKISQLYSPNFGLQYFLQAFDHPKNSSTVFDLSNIRIIYNGAEPISAPLCKEFLNRMSTHGLKSNTIFPGYGLAEASVAVSLPVVGAPLKTLFLKRNALQLDKELEVIHTPTSETIEVVEVGSPIDHCSVRIFGENGNPLANDRIGHIHIKGDNVTRGYYLNEIASAALFTTDGWLRTGDLGFLHDGGLFITGRLKNLIIVNGINFYPHDIEQVLQEELNVELGTIVVAGVREMTSLSDRLVVFILFKKEISNFVGIQKAVKAKLADCFGLEVSQVVPVRKIPKTTSGKVQNFRLVEKFEKGDFKDILNDLSLLSTPQVEPQVWNIDAVKSAVKRTWEEKFGVPIGDAFNFFRFGLNSIQITHFAIKISEEVGIPVSIIDVFDHPSIELLSSFIAEKALEFHQLDVSNIPTTEVDYSATSFVQKKFGILHSYAKKEPGALNISLAFELTGELKIDKFLDCWKDLFKVHEGLRSKFFYDKNIFKVDYVDVDSIITDFEYHDFSGSHNKVAIDALLKENTNYKFNLDEPPLVKGILIRSDIDEYLFSLTIHHIISDGWSVQLMLTQVSEMYSALIRNQELDVVESSFQYKEYIHKTASQNLSNEVDRIYWKNLLHERRVLSLSDGNGLESGDSFEGEKITFSLKNESSRKLKALSSNNESTVFVTLLTLVIGILHKYTSQNDIIIGTDTAGRDSKDFLNTVGYFLKTILIRAKFDTSCSFIDLLEIVKQGLLNGYTHQNYSFEQLESELKDEQKSPLIQVLVLYQNFQNLDKLLSIDNVESKRLDTPLKGSLVDLQWEFYDVDETLFCDIRYNTELYNKDFINSIARHFSILIEEVLVDPFRSLQSYSILTHHDVQLVKSMNQTDKTYNTKPLVQQIETIQKTYPDKTALLFKGEGITYDQLLSRASLVARSLLSMSGGSNPIVAIILPKSPDLVIGVLGALKAGFTYVPIDSVQFPLDRINYILKDANIKIILTNRETNESLQLQEKCEKVALVDGESFGAIEYLTEREVDFDLDDPMYIMYTSGSTGKPKGVVISHNSVIDYVNTFINYFGIDENDRVIQQSSIAFDTFIEEVFPALCKGGMLIVSENPADLVELTNLIEFEKATVLSTTPHVINELNNQVESINDLRILISGGDTLKAGHINQILKRGIPIYNTYGPTEATVCVSFHLIRSEEESSVIGKPISNHSIYILDQNDKLQPVGLRGEICISGSGLAKEYLNLPELTDEKFFDSPFELGKKMYRTGDIGFVSNEGLIVFQGRKDNQTKILGYRVEIEEVETVVCEYAAVERAGVVIRKSNQGTNYLHAYVQSQEIVDLEKLRKGLILRLPHYMVPRHLEQIEKIPLTTIGKISRHELSHLLPPQEIVQPYAEPTNFLEETLVRIWESIFKIKGIGIDDNFYEIGGQSLVAIQITNQIHKLLKVQLSPQMLFNHPTIHEISVLIESREITESKELVPISSADYYGASHAQKRLWILDQFETDQVAYNLFWAYNLEGVFELKILEDVLSTISGRHEILRTTFKEINGELKQFVCSIDNYSLPLHFEDISSRESGFENILKQVDYAEAHTVFDLSKGSLWRVRVVQYGKLNFRLCITFHHIITDGWSSEILLNEIKTLYEAYSNKLNNPLPVPSLQYKDFSTWQNKQIISGEYQKHEQYWLDCFSSGTPKLNLSLDKPRPILQTNYGRSLFNSVSVRTTGKMVNFCREQEVTTFMYALSSVWLLLSKYSGQNEMVIGTPVSGRTNIEFEKQIGLFVNTLPLKILGDVEITVENFLKHVKSVVLNAFDHQLYPFDMLVDKLNIESDLSRAPLFDVMISWRDAHRNESEFTSLGKAAVNPCKSPLEFSQFDLSFDFVKNENNLEIEFQYNSSLFDDETAIRILNNLSHIIDNMVNQKDVRLKDISCIAAEEKVRLLDEFGKGPSVATSHNTIITMLEEQIKRSPHTKAITFNEVTFTYSELGVLINKAASVLLRQYGLTKGTRIAVLVNKSEWTPIWALAIFKANCVFVPIDPEYPKNKILYIIEDSDAELIISDVELSFSPEDPVVQQKKLKKEVLEYSIADLVSDPDSDNLAYIGYASGTNTNSAGVKISHGNLVNFASGWQAICTSDSPFNWLQLASISLNVFLGDMCKALLFGGHLQICPDKIKSNIPELSKFIKEKEIDVLESTPAFIIPFMDYVFADFDEFNLKTLILGSDACKEEDYRRLGDKFRNKLKIINSYGTPETTIASSYFASQTNSSESFHGLVPIGKPTHNTLYYVLDTNQNLVPQGAIGELYIGGKGVSFGYQNCPEKTKSAFVDNSINRNLFKTSDKVKWLPDGNLEYIGKNDDQVSIKGYQMGVSEIENRLVSHPDITSVAVVLKEGENGTEDIHAFFTAIQDVKKVDIGSFLDRPLPFFMRPSNFIALSKMPLTFNGKVDYNALKGMVVTKKKTLKKPNSALEKEILLIWTEILDRNNIGVDDNFFELGGHSLSATRLANAVSKVVKKKITLRTIYTHSTIEELALIIQKGDEFLTSPIAKIKENTHYEISSSQKRLWLLQQFEEISNAYSMPVVYKLTGKIDTTAFANAYEALIIRHESLRTVFLSKGEEPYQCVNVFLENKHALNIVYQEDVHGLKGLLQEEIDKPFDLENGPLVRAILYISSENQACLFFNMHHLVSDAWSANILEQELVLCYNAFVKNNPNPLAPLRIQYKDYMFWQKPQLEGERLTELKKYWTSRLTGFAPKLNLPTDYNRPFYRQYQGDFFEIDLDNQLISKLELLARKQRTSLFSVFLTTFNTLLYQYTGQKDITVGIPVSGRKHSDLTNQVGYYSNTIPFRSVFDDKLTVDKLLEQVNSNLAKDLDQDNYPFDLLVDEFDTERDLSRSPLFDVMFVYNSIENNTTKIHDLIKIDAEPVEMNWKVSKYDFTLFIEKDNTSNTSKIKFEFDTSLFKKESILNLCEKYIYLLGEITMNLGSSIREQSLFTEKDERLLSEFNRTEIPYPDGIHITKLFEAQVLKSPENRALGFKENVLTYEQLNNKSNAFGRLLKEEYAVCTEEIVGIMMPKSVEMMIGVLAILKCGAAFLPIDPSWPQARKNFIIDDSQLKIIISDENTFLDRKDVSLVHYNEQQIELLPTNNIETDFALANLVYVLYTSGTTGKPKGVMIENHSVVNLSSWLTSLLYSGDNKVKIAGLTAGLHFDASIQQLFSPLICGSTLVLLDEEDKKDILKYADLLSQHRVEFLDLTPTMLEALLAIPSSHFKKMTLKYVLVGGEVLSEKVIKKFYNSFSNTSLINVYGVTEATVDSSFSIVSKQLLYANIGSPIPNTSIHICDSDNNELPIGMIGEICIGGVGVARGYLNRPDLNEQKFIKNPHGRGRLFKSGDMGRWRSDGTIDYLGREDSQIKMRGYRIEIEEIERVISEHSEVEKAIVNFQNVSSTDAYLEAFLLSHNELNIKDIYKYVSEFLPDYMLPTKWYRVTEIPTNSSGKVNKNSLSRENRFLLTDVEIGTAKTPTQKMLVKIWEQVLDQEVGINDNFFKIGGNSLIANRVVNRVFKENGIKIPLREIFLNSDINGLAPIVEKLSSEKYSPIIPSKEEPSYPVSFAQNRLWVLHQLDASGFSYNMPMLFEIEGSIKIGALEQIFQGLIENHEILRTNFVHLNGEIRQIVKTKSDSHFKIEHKTIFEQQDSENYLNAEVHYPFDLENDILIRASLVSHSDSSHLLLINLHHIISDGWSNYLLAKQFLNGFQKINQPDRPFSSNRNSIQYKDFVVWQQKQQTEGKWKVSQEYWLNKFINGVPKLNIPTTHSRPATKTANGNHEKVIIDDRLFTSIDRMSKENNVSVFVFLLAAVKSLLFRYSGEESIIVGTPVLGRRHPDIEDQIGLFINTLPLGTECKNEDTFLLLMDRVNAVLADALEHQDYPFDLLVESLEVERDSSRNPLFDVMILWNEEDDQVAINTTNIKRLDVETNSSKFDLTFSFSKNEEGLHVEIEYSVDLFDDKYIKRLLSHLINSIRSAVGNPDVTIGGIEFLSIKEKEKILKKSKGEFQTYEEISLAQMFESSVERNAEKTAVYADQMLSYSDLNERSNRLANYLQEQCLIKRNDLVAVLVDRSEWTIVVLLGILKAGAAYVPIDKDYPELRINYIVENSGAKILITDGPSVLDENSSLRTIDIIKIWPTIDQYGAENLSIKNLPNDLAYIIYTSGSTGSPKGVRIEHRNAMALISWAQREYENSDFDVVFFATSYCFDLSVFEIFYTLSIGKPLQVLSSALEISKFHKNHEKILLNTVPSVVDALLTAKVDLSNISVLNMAGESIPKKTIQRLGVLSNIEIRNLYGPSEDTTYSTVYKLKESDVYAPIGKPVDNTQIYIVDEKLNLLPDGFTGEIVIGGDGLSSGYLNDIDLTHLKFVENHSLSESKLYLTGDLAYWNKEGEIVFVGRSDKQIKLRGYRIELNEIEQAILKVPNVNDSVVRLIAWQGGDELVAYYKSEDFINHEEIESLLHSVSPKHMVPNFFIHMEEWPTNSNGKIDYDKFPMPSLASVSLEQEEEFSETEQFLLDTWKQIVGIKEITKESHFFKIGGNSLKVIQLYEKISEQYPNAIEIFQLFSASTIKKQAALLQVEEINNKADNRKNVNLLEL